MEDETEEQQKEESLDSSTLSIQSEIDGQKRCLEILNNNSNVPKDFEQIGGFKGIKILGEQKKPEFIQFVNNKKTTNKATNDNVFSDEEYFYHAVLRTIGNEKGIKFIGKNIQKYSGGDLPGNAEGGDDVTLCLFFIANLFNQVANRTVLIGNICYFATRMSLLKPDNNQIWQEMNYYAKKQSNKDKIDKKAWQKILQDICEKLDEIIDLFPEDKKKIINKFLCQLFFLIFFTNKIDIKPENILVEKNNNNVKIIHTDVDDYPRCKGMFDTFKNHEQYGWYFNKLFLKTIWKRISSNELSKYFNEYIEKYTLTEEKLKKIISRTVRNFFRSNDDIETNKINVIDSPWIKHVCQRLFEQMNEYMRYMLDTVIPEIELDEGNNEKKLKLINVLEQNCKVLNDMFAGHTIDDCVNNSITKYKTLKQKLQPDKKYEQPKNIQAKYNCWCIGDNDYVGCKTDGSGCGCFGCDIC